MSECYLFLHITFSLHNSVVPQLHKANCMQMTVDGV